MKGNPFNLIFGKEPSQVISRITESTGILESFLADPPEQQIYMITGVRGCGKTVFMTEIAKELKSYDWIIVELNPSRDMMTDLAASLGSENHLARIFQKASINLSLFGIGLEVKESVPISNIQVALTKMLESLKKHGKKVLVCIDEVTATESMKLFSSAFQIFIRQDLPLFLLMTGLYENINDLQNEKNLTFLYRAPKLELKPLNLGIIADNYQRNFNLDYDASEEMAKLTKGYSFAFQVLGHFTWKYEGDYKKALPDYRHYLEDYVYDKIWSELSSGDRKLALGVARSEDGKAKSIKELCGMTDSEYSVYRDRLLKRGVLAKNGHGYVQFTLPLFEKYVMRK